MSILLTETKVIDSAIAGRIAESCGKHKVIIWRAEMLENNKYIGIPGQIAEINSEGLIVVCVDGLLKVTEYETLENFKMFNGHKLK